MSTNETPVFFTHYQRLALGYVLAAALDFFEVWTDVWSGDMARIRGLADPDALNAAILTLTEFGVLEARGLGRWKIHRPALAVFLEPMVRMGKPDGKEPPKPEPAPQADPNLPVPIAHFTCPCGCCTIELPSGVYPMTFRVGETP